ncbi:MAG TPA: hypothetical protein PKV71_01455 [Calditrichia bacterium]|nr:hypothetical protein [Calditrichota bacterium]HQU74913.1 hypothetical protein [Calditrichia bacterium]HQV30507.1 hypothetical protein [Calditrichia bacterium]
MQRRTVHYHNPASSDLYRPRQRRNFFFGWFKRKSAPRVELRPGALTPEEVKSAIGGVDLGEVMEIFRIGYDGIVDEVPIIVELVSVNAEGFSGKIVNVERRMIEANSSKAVYARQGGGTLEFSYNDGDIKYIRKNNDVDTIEESRDVSVLLEMLGALDVDDRVLVAYYDKKHRGTVNVEGVLDGKSQDNRLFKMVIDKINNIELDNKLEKQFDVERDLVIDISLY